MVLIIVLMNYFYHSAFLYEVFLYVNQGLT
jgi:hypothetical protein